jgi:anaerobic ribonucleoside-triphosphate reductase
MAAEILQLGTIFNQWSKVRITDKHVMRLIQEAMSPSKEVLDNVRKGAADDLSTCFYQHLRQYLSVCYEQPYPADGHNQRDAVKAYNAITGYFQNVKEFKTGDEKLNSILFDTGLQRSQTAFKLCEQF